jgi:hypothetical protein
LPAVDALLSRYATAKVGDYVTQLGQPNVSAFQDNQDFIREVANYTRETLGPELGNAISEDLRELPQVLTANHHGIDTFAQSTQSNLLFSMRKKADGSPVKTVPVLACGSVPMNNLTYPRGFLIYAGSAATGDGEILKLPLFPDSYKRKLVSIAGPFTTDMLCRSRARAKNLMESDKLNPGIEFALNKVFDDCASIGQEFPGYSRQATIANHRFWRHLFQDGVRRSDLVYLELENIVCRLLVKDLFDQSTISHQLLFDPELRGKLIDNLNGQRGCWHHEKLSIRCSDSSDVKGQNTTDSTQGTIFFWGVDEKGRKIPLYLVEGSKTTSAELRGIDDSGKLFTCPFTPADINRGLQDGRLLPSIFTSYLLVSIARGISCIGGYYQAEYLPIMRTAVIDTLRSNSGKTIKTFDSGKLCPDPYLSGMQTIGLKTGSQLFPAGPLEIIASGGLSAEQLQQVGGVTVLQSHIASLYDTMTDVAPQRGDSNLEKKEISRLVHDAVGSKILTISLG